MQKSLARKGIVFVMIVLFVGASVTPSIGGNVDLFKNETKSINTDVIKNYNVKNKISDRSDFAGGSGTPSDPYQIANVTHLQNMELYLDAHYIIINDIDASATSGWNSGQGFDPIGYGTYFGFFIGTFDGQDYTITNLYINRPSTDNIGLFGSVGDNGQVENVGLENVDVTGDDFVGGLVGFSNECTIYNCYTTGDVSGSGDTGGLIGLNQGWMAHDCYSTCGVTGGHGAGGLIGSNGGLVLYDCYATGNVNGGNRVGGLIGDNWMWSDDEYEAVFTDCYATGNVGGEDYVGGLVGYYYFSMPPPIDVNIDNCYATGDVTGDEYVGGLVGYVYGGDEKLVGYNYGPEITLLHPFNQSFPEESNRESAGSGDGSRWSNINYCYSTGYVTGNESGPKTVDLVGGLIGYREGNTSVVGCFWDIQTSGQSSSAGGTGKTTAEMKTKSTFTNAGWDFTNIWDIIEGVTYPFLRWQNTGGDLVADAGGPYMGNLGGTIQLSGSASGGILPYSYAWDIDDDVQYDDETGPTPTINVNDYWTNTGDYTIGLQVTDNGIGTDTDTAIVTVGGGNQPPLLSGESPADDSMCIDVNLPSVSVYIEDPEGYPFNWTIEGDYIVTNSSTDDVNGTKSASLITPLPFGATVVWYVNVTDGYGWAYSTYEFFTLFPVYVDDDFSSSTPGWGYDHFDNIQDGVDAVCEGGTVFVYNGTYYEYVVVGKDNVNIIGNDSSSVIMTGNGIKTIGLSGVDTANVTISGMSFTNYTMYAVYLSHVYHFNVNNCTFYNNGHYGIEIDSNGNNCTFEDNEFRNTIVIPHSKGININAFSCGNVVNNNIIMGGNSCGIELSWYCHENVITNNVITASVARGGSGIVFDGNDNLIKGNYIFNCSNRGISLYDGEGNTIIGNIIFNCSNIGIRLHDGERNTIKQNFVSTNGSYGIYLEDSSNNIIYYNNVQNSVTQNAFDDGTNDWNSSYPFGGNYWDDYSGFDDYSGSNQDVPGSDGIGDTPYNISGDSNQDLYPLMYLWGENPPVANFSYSMDNLSVIFDASSSYDRDGSIVSYDWDFGDEEYGNGILVNHTYSEGGEYPVTLTVTDDVGYQGNITKIIVVGGLNQPPYSPSAPQPSDGAVDVDIDTDLNWTGGDPDPDDTVTYDVYFGTISPPPLVVSGQSNTTYDPGTMTPNTQYAWKIVSWDNHGASTSGPEWNFTTENNPPYEPANPVPNDGATDVSIDANLSWTGGDPDPGDTVTYDVYFGTTSPPPQVTNNQTELTYDPGTLTYETTYYWKIIAWDNHGASTSGPVWNFTTEEEYIPEPDLYCEGSLYWDGVNSGEPVTGSFLVFNVGDPSSLLNWEIVDWPDWGTWAFTPDSGEDLTPEDGAVTVTVFVDAPDEEDTEFIGEVRIVNTENSDDYYVIPVYLRTPVSQDSTSSRSLFYQSYIEKLMFIIGA